MTFKTVRADLIRDFIRSKKWGMQHLVIQSNVCETTIRQAMKGMAPQSKDDREGLAKALNVSVDHLFPDATVSTQAA